MRTEAEVRGDKVMQICKQLVPVEIEFVRKTGLAPNRFRNQLTKKETETLVKFCRFPSVYEILAKGSL